jgi:hypothetical protein
MATSRELANAQPLIAVPEYRVQLPGGRRASQNDILVLGRASGSAFAMVVEGKVSESFGPVVREWLARETPGRLLRWSFLCNLLSIDGTGCRDLRYQLFHRAASAILAAEIHHSRNAILLVHSFSAARAGFSDYGAFLRLFGVEARVDVSLALESFKVVNCLLAGSTGSRHTEIEAARSNSNWSRRRDETSAPRLSCRR